MLTNIDDLSASVYTDILELHVGGFQTSTFIRKRNILSLVFYVYTYLTCLVQSIFTPKRLHLDILFGGHIMLHTIMFIED